VARMHIIYDVENIKTPRHGATYRSKNVDIKKASDAIKKRFPALYTAETAFLRIFHDNGARIEKVKPFLRFLAANNIKVKTKKPKQKRIEGVYQGQKYIHTYSQGDMDCMIIEEILRSIDTFTHIVVFSGDGDMISALKFAERMGVEVTVVAHEENISAGLLKFDHIFLHSILEKEDK